ncbi:MAG TPA: hypothetical protein VFE92_19750, partial [Dermatophilaceae bacterium]|nr:hypothetical protein [Dermatophilaceae bacterium]
RGKVNNHRNEMAYRGDSVDALIKIYGARIGGPDHDPTACEYLAAGRHRKTFCVSVRDVRTSS